MHNIWCKRRQACKQQVLMHPACLYCREHWCDAKLASVGSNNLTIVVHPASARAKKHYDSYPYEVPTMSVSALTYRCYSDAHTHTLSYTLLSSRPPNRGLQWHCHSDITMQSTRVCAQQLYRACWAVRGNALPQILFPDDTCTAFADVLRIAALSVAAQESALTPTLVPNERFSCRTPSPCPANEELHRASDLYIHRMFLAFEKQLCLPRCHH